MKLKIIVMAICLFAILTIPSLNAMDDENSTFRDNIYCEYGELIPIESEGEVEDKLNAEELENELTTYDSVSNDELNSVEPENIIIPQVFNSNGSGEITLELPEGSTGQVSLYTKENDDMGNLILNVIMRNSPYSSFMKIFLCNCSKNKHIRGDSNSKNGFIKYYEHIIPEFIQRPYLNNNKRKIIKY